MPRRLKTKTKTQREYKFKKSKSNIHANPSHRICILQASPLIPKSSSSCGRPRLGSVAGSKRSLTEPSRPQCSGQRGRETATRNINGVLETQRQGLLSAPQPSLIIWYWLYGWRTPDSSFPPYVIFRKANLDNSEVVTHRLPPACPQRRDCQSDIIWVKPGPSLPHQDDAH